MVERSALAEQVLKHLSGFFSWTAPKRPCRNFKTRKGQQEDSKRTPKNDQNNYIYIYAQKPKKRSKHGKRTTQTHTLKEKRLPTKRASNRGQSPIKRTASSGSFRLNWTPPRNGKLSEPRYLCFFFFFK